MRHKNIERDTVVLTTPKHTGARFERLYGWLPNRGTVLFVLMVVMVQLFANRAGAFPFLATTATSTSVISYQGRLTDSGGNSLTGAYDMVFRFYNASSGGSPLWSESWTDVQVTNGSFNVMLGSVTAIPQSVITSNSNLWLGIKVGTDNEMTPRAQLGSVPFATQALTVPDGSITTSKIGNSAVTAAKLDLSSGLTVSGTLSADVIRSVDQWREIKLTHTNPSNGGWMTFFLTGGANPDGAFVFRKEDWSDNPFLLKIESPTGNVGIGTMAPDEKLTVNGYMKTIVGNEGGGLLMVAGNGAVGQIYVVDSGYSCSSGGGVAITSDDGVSLCFRKK